MGKKVIACFLPADSSLLEDHWLNRAAAKWSPAPRDASHNAPMVHTELFFPSDAAETSGSITGRSLGIHYGGKVFWAPKRFSKAQWQFRSIPCTDAQYNTMINFSRKQMGGAFNYRGYFTPCGVSSALRSTSLHNTQSWYCSELVAHALWHGELLPSALTSGLHPQTLFDDITDLGSAFHDTARDIASANIKI